VHDACPVASADNRRWSLLDTTPSCSPRLPLNTSCSADSTACRTDETLSCPPCPRLRHVQLWAAKGSSTTFPWQRTNHGARCAPHAAPLSAGVRPHSDMRYSGTRPQKAQAEQGAGGERQRKRKGKSKGKRRLRASVTSTPSSLVRQ
jgi:hypothetical protein